MNLGMTRRACASFAVIEMRRARKTSTRWMIKRDRRALRLDQSPTGRTTATSFSALNASARWYSWVPCGVISMEDSGDLGSKDHCHSFEVRPTTPIRTSRSCRTMWQAEIRHFLPASQELEGGKGRPSSATSSAPKPSRSSSVPERILKNIAVKAKKKRLTAFSTILA